MTTFCRDNDIGMARCSNEGCDHDLVTRNDGKVYCSRSVCKYNRTPHPTKAALNKGSPDRSDA